ncbi:MAG: hypothetical protein V8R91_01665 [Butyricimonas faecihominis]
MESDDDGEWNVIFLCLSGLLSRLMTCGKKGKQRFLKGFNVLDHAKYQLVLEAEEEPCHLRFPSVPPKQGTPPPVPPLGVKQPAEGPASA